jgi:O-methyltransferase
LLDALLHRRRASARRPPDLGAEEPLYAPRYSPWLDPRGFARVYERVKQHTLVDAERSYVLHTLARQATHVAGEFWECGVYRGGTACLLADVASKTRRPLRLFDTFSGMPSGCQDLDWHQAGDFADTSLLTVRALVTYEGAIFHQGVIPQSFAGLEATRIAFAHIDVDLYQSVLDSCTHIYPRLAPGGILVFDDYGWPTCVGARRAVDDYFRDKPEIPLVLSTGQAIVFRLPGPDTSDALPGIPVE